MIKNLLWQRSSGYWLFWTSAVYFGVGIHSIFFNPGMSVIDAQIVWLVVLAMPLYIPPLARYLNMTPLWGKTKKEEAPVTDNVVDFPVPKSVPPMPEVKPAKVNKEYYRVGYNESTEQVTLTLLTDGGGVTLSMNYYASEHLIKMIRSAFPDDGENDGN